MRLVDELGNSVAISVLDVDSRQPEITAPNIRKLSTFGGQPVMPAT
jgi:hypothetical protein